MSMYDRDWYRESIREERERARRQEETAKMSWLVALVCPALTLVSTQLSLRQFAGNPLLPMVSVIVNAIAFAKIGRERTRGHRGMASAVALIVTMLGFVLSFVLTFFMVYARAGA